MRCAVLLRSKTFFQEISKKVDFQEGEQRYHSPWQQQWYISLWMNHLSMVATSLDAVSPSILSFDHCNRRKSGQNPDKILLIGHHLVDVLVGAGGLIKMILRSDAVDDALAVKHLNLLLKREGQRSLPRP